MTIYTGHIVAAATFLRELVDDIGDLEQASTGEIAELKKASRTLKGALSVAVTSADSQIGSDGAGGFALLVPGAFPLDVLPVITGQLANLEQMDVLLDTLGYAGRVLLNSEQAG